LLLLLLLLLFLSLPFLQFYRYVQWHNLAFSMSREMNLPTMMLHYDEYTTDYEGTRDRVLDFLELPHVVSVDIPFAGEMSFFYDVYRHNL
jgi:hypothetical protein